MAEIEASPLKRLFFVDDNLTINRQFAREFLPRLKGRGYSWISQVSIDIAKDPELLGLMAESGCDSILIGFESVNQESLAETHKHQNLKVDYEQAIRAVHDAGIHLLASFVVGFDHDTRKAFDDIYELSMRAFMPYVTINILGCSPGTDLDKRLVAEGRLIPNIPSYFRGGMFPVVRYRQMSGTEMFGALIDTAEKLFSFETAYHKGMGLFSRGTFSRSSAGAGVGVMEKLRISLLLVRLYLFSADPWKRKLIVGLFRLFRRKKVAVERVVTFLLSMEGFHRYIEYLKTRKSELVGKISAVESQP